MKLIKSNKYWLVVDKRNAIYIQNDSLLKSLFDYCFAFCLRFYIINVRDNLRKIN